MIISPGRRYIFVHIPKTGGTSMALALEGRAMKDDILIGDTPKARRRKRRLQGVSTKGRLWKHSTLADVDGLITADQARDWFVFSLVRNPWDRMVSYYHWLRDQRFDHPSVTLAAKLSFNDFVLHDQTRAAMRAWPVQRYLTSAAGVDCADAYVRLEHLDEDLNVVQKHLGFALQLPHANPSDRPSGYADVYSTAAAQAVAEDCAPDINAFRYRFRPDPN